MTLCRWKQNPEFAEAIKGVVVAKMLFRLKKIENGDPGWQGAAWFLERQYPHRYARPEVQLNLINGTGGIPASIGPREMQALTRLGYGRSAK